MLGRFDEARAILAETRAELAERGGGRLLANITTFESVWVELLAGDPATAAAVRSRRVQAARGAGRAAFLATLRRNLAYALYALDRLDEADAVGPPRCELGAERGRREGDVWRRVRAKVLARHGEHVEASGSPARRLHRRRDRDAQRSGNAYADLGEVLLSPESRPKPPPRSSRRWTLRSQGQRRLGPARRRTARGSPCVIDPGAPLALGGTSDPEPADLRLGLPDLVADLVHDLRRDLVHSVRLARVRSRSPRTAPARHRCARPTRSRAPRRRTGIAPSLRLAPLRSPRS